MADRSIILDLQLNQGQLLANLGKAQKSVRDLRNEQRALEKAIKLTGDENGEFEKQLAGVNAQLIQERKNLAGAKKDVADYSKANKQATGSINEMRGQLSILVKQYDNLSKEQRENIEIGGKLKKQIADQTDELKELEGQTGRNQRNVGNYKEAVTGLIGDFRIFGVSLNSAQASLQKLRTATIASTAATSGASKGLNLFKIALISTGIGAIVVLLGTLVAAFLSTQKGIDTVTKALQPLRVAFQSVIGFVQNVAIITFDGLAKAVSNPKEAFISLGNTIKEQFTNRIEGLVTLVKSAVGVFTELPKALQSGDFSKVADNLEGVANGFVAVNTGVTDATGKLKKAGQGFNDTLDDIGATAARLNAIYDELKLLRATEASDLAKLNVKLQENQLIARDQSKTLDERKEALDNVNEAIEGQFEVQSKLLELQIEQIEREAELNDTLDEEQVNIDKLNAELIQLEARRAQQKRETLEIENQLRNLNTQYGANATSIKGLSTALSQLKSQIELLPSGSPLFEKLGKQADQLQVKLNALKNLYSNLSEEFTEEDPELLSPEDQLKLLGLSKDELDPAIIAFADKTKALLDKALQGQIDKDFVAPEGVTGAFGLTDEELKEFNKKLNDVSSTYNDFANGINSIIQASTQFRLNEVDKETQARIASVKKQSLSEEEKEKRITAIQEAGAKKRESLERAAKKKQKAIAITTAIINGALAITQSIANTTLPFPASLAGPLAIGAATAASVAQIASQQYAKGGEIPAGGGFITGASHAQGGVKFSAGGQTMEAEGGEIIVNKGIQSRPDYVAAISKMNAATGGVDFYKSSGKRFALGGTVSGSTSGVAAQVRAERSIRRSIENAPAPVVYVDDINNQQTKVRDVEVRSIIG